MKVAGDDDNAVVYAIKQIRNSGQVEHANLKCQINQHEIVGTAVEDTSFIKRYVPSIRKEM